MKYIYLLLLFIFPACSSLMYQPTHTLYFDPEEHGYNKQDIYFEAKDGTKLFAWFFKAKNAKGTIVQFHGNAQNISSHFASLAWITRNGYNLFVWDYRGYGKSKGTATPENVYTDGVEALNVAFKLHKQTGAKKFIVYGQSLGATIAMRSIMNFHEKVDLLIVESGFLSYKHIYSEIMFKSILLLPFSFIPYLTVSDQYAPITSIEKLSVPLLVIHDKLDPIVSFSNSEQIYDKATCKKELWSTEDNIHIGFTSKKENRDRLLRYL